MVSEVEPLNPPSFVADHSLYAMVSCILLAAGESLRFGSPKPLARLGARTIIEFIQERLLLTKLSEIIIVLGCKAETIAPLIFKCPRIKHVINENYERGQTSSFKAGLSLVSQKSEGIMLLPIDMPLVKPPTIDELIHVFLKKSPPILVPIYQDKKGHPPIFSMRLRKELMNLKDGEPLFVLLHKHEAEILKIPVDDEGVVLSFNTPEEFKELIKKLDMTCL